MASFITRRWVVVVVVLCGAALGALVFLIGGSATAAPPYEVTYQGTPVTTAVPGKVVTVNYKVTNTGTTEYSGVKVIFHVPEGLTHSSVSPPNAVMIDDTVTWNNVPIAAGKSFYPSLTMTMDASTPLKTKKSVWVEVTGTDMEASSYNFSLTAVSAASAATATTSTTLSSATVSSIFQLAYDRAATGSELTYWLGRRTDKAQQGVLYGAMQYHKQQSIQH